MKKMQLTSSMTSCIGESCELQAEIYLNIAGKQLAYPVKIADAISHRLYHGFQLSLVQLTCFQFFEYLYIGWPGYIT